MYNKHGINDVSMNAGVSTYLFDKNGEKVDNRPDAIRRINDFNIVIKDYGKLDTVEAIDNLYR